MDRCLCVCLFVTLPLLQLWDDSIQTCYMGSAWSQLMNRGVFVFAVDLGGRKRDANSLCKCVSCSATSRWGRVLQVSTIYSAVFLSPCFPVSWGVLNYKQWVCFCFMHTTSWVIVITIILPPKSCLYTAQIKVCVRRTCCMLVRSPIGWVLCS